ncbi:phosphoribosylamine--glycine ligase : Phosphoribosylamine--glycine ligase OS=Blastopirellula marina DSM 3645 GN=purD PE=3 SV=1: GARS_N: GARS_A: GARS_C [Tuwongella immobilis]|uniref:Phosphoribosylamine--glycine ligase n=2 Tax=Tuwongella immobilis TaxID=692036 RepID=A0A6C2YMM7_9BACT|nr:phosphoribosylamine--glycine ligase [Tuwongella immobilis]VIP02624.1 phosphoribosylamine--glycine ligase : Phosphoribosylamine--glycine ligase OS=Blastopirellula marina DSM 3645 GN=purD PE=3 SV=1: GARS_N: GARS_A: GARS_C [Tuwongella immobilis]VTS01960.1 phosphoribosylamine--glycine ligase : Phosphoribosylamine--glycine ligase OS=Blastopirellula marina DSM 3645 GN=purD PE=3 SV=1: GARS_N: GARS_A: GARS_C [Tuwongella immobilis]
MNVLVIGKGGREHAIVWKLRQSPRAGKIFVAPGNAGTALEATNVPIQPNDVAKLIQFAKKESIGLTIIGPEDPLAAGIVDAFQAEGLRVFGPSKAAAQLEASKVFSKTLMRNADVPTSEFRLFDHPDPAKSYIESREYPVVVKADGLAAGKGVFVCSDKPAAVRAVERIMIHEEFGAKVGRQIVIEKRLEGEELSSFALISGRTILPLPCAQDHKAVFDNDEGPNTGGMGAYCPAPIGTPELLAEVDESILVPVVHAMKRGRTPFKGVLFTGLMLTNQGPKVLEFNCRFGDPETQPLLMRLKTDLLELLEAVVDERLDEFPAESLQWDPRPAVCVVLASGGYPGKYETDKIISGLDEVAQMPDVKVFHAGTKLIGNRVMTDGGRVLAVTALGDDLLAAKTRAYEAVAKIHFNGMHYRKDIADKALRVKPTPKAPSELNPALAARIARQSASDAKRKTE